MSLLDMRQIYDEPPVRRADLDADPFAQFADWFARHRADLAEGVEANAMALATVDADGSPSARMVLLKGHGPRGFLFFSNYESRKGLALAADPRAALLFFWPERQRQIRIEGAVTRLSEERSDAYFDSRPPGSRLAAVTSAQSRVVADRAALESRMADLAAQHEDGSALARPADWGGYRLEPQVFEFWQGRPNRLHDRFRYRREEGSPKPGTSHWLIERLAP